MTRMGRAARESVAGLPRAFWWLWVCTLVNRLGGFVATFLALYLTLERGYSPFFAGLVAALHGLGGVIASVGAGVLTDRLGRRPTLMIAQVGTAASVALLGFVHDPVSISGAAFLVGLASNSSRPAVTAMMADIVRPEDRLRAYSINYWAINLGFAISSTAAGFVAEYSYLAGFLGEAAITLACAVLAYFTLPESRPEPAAPSAAGEGAPAVGLGTVLRDGRFMGVTGLAFLVALLFTQSSVALPVAMGRAGLSTQDYGMVMAVNGIMIVALQIPVTRLIERRDPRMLLVFSALLAGYGFGLTAFAGSVGFFALTIAVWTLAEIVNAPTQSGMVVRFSPRHARGRYQGVFSLSWTLSSLVAPLTGGAVIEEFGADVLWAGCAVIGTFAAAGYWLLTRNLPEEGAMDAVRTGGTEREERPAPQAA
ncbi:MULTISPECIES: MDR family MFS transporter [Streptomyces]|uniref:MDR family MFS transporter n=1 Tax=Streptomyces TaxID=1883 RepID=UPI00163CA5D8|nr:MULTISPECIES: MFS transporter [Streptomyces]MBC2874973.1 MFS transporter [Streptomyces sp. TYQ1024]UBI41099.1 MFS transporter [Streptomyces mobaraensis]UKW33588.1 MFS transporter [Streptomyces sp. TYQ1024]